VTNYLTRMEIAIYAAVEAGKVLLQHYDDKLQISVKESYRDVATDVDRLAENIIIEKIRSRDSTAKILAEEHADASENSTSGGLPDQLWIVDALDGTVNYLSGIPFFSVSIAYIENGSVKVGVIYNPIQDDLYYGADGVGAFKNQDRLSITDRTPQDCLFAVAFSGKSYDPAKREKEFIAFQKVNDVTRGCIRTGSASMNLALLAEGKLGGCWGKAGKVWDISAGIFLAETAGAKVTTTPINSDGILMHYVATVPSAFDFINKRIQSI
jgi:myo-inositol-1(or 4)-monophosphatase